MLRMVTITKRVFKLREPWDMVTSSELIYDAHREQLLGKRIPKFTTRNIRTPIPNLYRWYIARTILMC